MSLLRDQILAGSCSSAAIIHGLESIFEGKLSSMNVHYAHTGEIPSDFSGSLRHFTENGEGNLIISLLINWNLKKNAYLWNAAAEYRQDQGIHRVRNTSGGFSKKPVAIQVQFQTRVLRRETFMAIILTGSNNGLCTASIGD